MTAATLKKQFPELEASLITEMAEVGEERSFHEGDVLMRTGQPIRSAMLVTGGLIKISREDDQGNEFFMYYLDEGKACAVSLVCALGREQSTLVARAVTDATVLAIPLQYVDAWMGTYKSWAQFALTSYRQRFDELLQTIDHVAFRNMDERLVFYLKKYQEQFDTPEVRRSITDIAQDLNSSREVISRLLKKLAERGVVTLHRSHITLIGLNEVYG